MTHRMRAACRLATIVLGVLGVAGFLGCRSLAPAGASGVATAAPARHRVILVSLDGASAENLQRFRAAGVLDAGGFARFFAAGQVAAGLVTVNPTLTSPNHISLATGFNAAATGIVGNRFHPAGMPWGATIRESTVSGFDAPIATETLWEAARRQGRTVGVLAWPGADGKGERRHGDWGFTYAPDHKGDVVTPTPVYPEALAADLRAAGPLWPAAPDGDALTAGWRGRPGGIDLETWTAQAERFTRFFGAHLAAAAKRPDWDLLMGYFPSIDEAGHELSLADPRQQGFSPERQAACARAQERVWRAVDAELARLLAVVDLRDTEVIVVSDHGMAPVHTGAGPNALLAAHGLQTVDAEGRAVPRESAVVAVTGGGMAHVYLAGGASPEPALRERTLAEVRQLFLDWRIDGERPVARVLSRAEAAEIGLNHPDSGDLILLANLGFGLVDGGDPRTGVAPLASYGMHGYWNNNPIMRGIFLALGGGSQPDEKGLVSTTAVAGRVAEWLGIERPRPSPP